MIWVATRGRASRVLRAEHHDEVRARMVDLARHTDACADFLDLDRCDANSSPLLWVSEHVQFGPVTMRPAIQIDPDTGITIDRYSAAFHGTPVDGFTPTRVDWQFDLYSAPPDLISVMLRWDAAVQLDIPRVAAGPANSRFQHTFQRYGNTLIDRLFDGLGIYSDGATLARDTVDIDA